MPRVSAPDGLAEHPLLGTPRRDALAAAILAFATAVLFVLVAVGTTRTHVQAVDQAFLRRMLGIRSSPLTVAAKVLNVLGLTFVTLPVRLAIAAFLAWRRRWWHLLSFVSAIVVSEVLIGTLKGLYDRPRPPGSLVQTSGASFPSGHAVAASVTVVAAVIALFPEGPRRFAWGVAAAAFALLMGLSRAYLAAHWLSDAIGGVLLGTSVAMFCALVVHTARERSGRGGQMERKIDRSATDRVEPPEPIRA
jgi:undecaprenyl-diphosphatase